jgi:hypothetical protein
MRGSSEVGIGGVMGVHTVRMLVWSKPREWLKEIMGGSNQLDMKVVVLSRMRSRTEAL